MLLRDVARVGRVRVRPLGRIVVVEREVGHVLDRLLHLLGHLARDPPRFFRRECDVRDELVVGALDAFVRGRRAGELHVAGRLGVAGTPATKSLMSMLNHASVGTPMLSSVSNQLRKPS